MLTLAQNQADPPQRRTAPPRSHAPADAAGLLRAIEASFEQLSPQLRSVARYVERHHDSLILERIQDVAARCQVQPSAVVRFAKHFGYHGFSTMKRALGSHLPRAFAGIRPWPTLPDGPVPALADARPANPAAPPLLSAQDAALACLQQHTAQLQQLQRDLHLSVLADAVALITQARSLWIVGAQRAFPVAAYLAETFQHSTLPVQFVSLLGGLQAGQLRSARAGDVMLAVSLAPHPAETLEAIQLLRTRGGRVIAITDRAPTTLHADVDLALTIDEPATLGGPGLGCSFAVAQSLVAACTHQMARSSP